MLFRQISSVLIFYPEVNYKQANDQELLQCCRRDDVRAYNELFRRHSPKLYRQAARYILDSNAAEELMLDLLFDLWEKRHQRNIEGDLSAYLYRCMRNMIVDYRRRIIPDTTPLEETHIAALQEHKQSDHRLMVSDANELYQSVLASMSPQRRRVFQLSREENLTYAEIAKEMNLSVNTVENYMAAALETFRSRTKGYLSVANAILCAILAGCSLAGIIL